MCHVELWLDGTRWTFWRWDYRFSCTYLRYAKKSSKVEGNQQRTSNQLDTYLLNICTGEMSTVRKYQCMCGAFEAQVTGEPVLAVSFVFVLQLADVDVLGL